MASREGTSRDSLDLKRVRETHSFSDRHMVSTYTWESSIFVTPKIFLQKSEFLLKTIIENHQKIGSGEKYHPQYHHFVLFLF